MFLRTFASAIAVPFIATLITGCASSPKPAPAPEPEPEAAPALLDITTGDWLTDSSAHFANISMIFENAVSFAAALETIENYCGSQRLRILAIGDSAPEEIPDDATTMIQAASERMMTAMLRFTNELEAEAEAFAEAMANCTGNDDDFSDE